MPQTPPRSAPQPAQARSCPPPSPLPWPRESPAGVAHTAGSGRTREPWGSLSPKREETERDWERERVRAREGESATPLALNTYSPALHSLTLPLSHSSLCDLGIRMIRQVHGAVQVVDRA